MDIVVEVLGGAILALVGWSAAIAFGKWWQPSRRRRIIWRMDIGREEQPRLILDSVQGGATPTYTRPSTGYGAAVSAGLVVNSLNAAQAALLRRYTSRSDEPLDVLLASDVSAASNLKDFDTVIIGGPKTNQVAQDFLNKVGCQGAADPQNATRECLSNRSCVGVATVDNTIWFYGNPYTGNVTSQDPTHLSGFNGEDYGVIIRAFNHASAGADPKRAVLLFGSQTFGVIGASRYLVGAIALKRSRLSRDKLLFKALRSELNVAILVKHEVVNGKEQPARLVEFHRLEPDVGLKAP